MWRIIEIENSTLLDNTKRIRDAMLADQIVWKGFFRIARDDSRPKQVIKHVPFEWLSHHKPNPVSLFLHERFLLMNFILQLPEDVCVLEAGSNLVT